MPLESQQTVLIGTPISRGIAIGRPFFFFPIENSVSELAIPPEAIDAEVARYQKAVSKARDEVVLLQNRLQAEHIKEGAEILDAHFQVMQDPLLTTDIESEIRKAKRNAEYVFQETIKKYQNKFNSITDPFFRERFKDIKDISQRVLEYLREGVCTRLVDIPPNSIIFASDLTTLDTAEANSACVGAFVTTSGGMTSHAAIVAKGRGIPYVSSIDFSELELPQNGLVIVDGRTGEVIFNPSEETLVKYQHLKNQLSLHMLRLNQTSMLEAETYDGYKVKLSANVETIGEIDTLHQYGGNGVGLLRTESIFLSRDDFPSEEEQFAIYRRFVEKMNGLPIAIRTFDLGGDKYLLNASTHEGNPFLGCRAIRYLLREKEVFKTQLRAILRASIYGNVSVMFPMVSALSELQEAKQIVEEARHELIVRGEAVGGLAVGCMIEVPSAAVIADLLAKECDFLSIGTNDLVQYSLAVDRGNHAISDLYTPTHPCVIRLIRFVVSEANYHNIPVTVCGEVASDPRFTPLLLGLGVQELSVAARYLPIIKNVIRHTSIVQASKLAEIALTLSSAVEIEELLTHEYRRNVPEDCFYNC